MDKLLAFIDVFRKGRALADPEKWDKGLIQASVVAGFLAGCLHLIELFTDWDIPITASDLDLVAGMFVTIVTVGIGIARNHGIGILPAKPPAEPVPAPERPAIDIHEAYPGTDHTAFPAQWNVDPNTGKVQPVDQAPSSATRQPNLDTDLYKG